jgi:hypothetical protein
MAVLHLQMQDKDADAGEQQSSTAITSLGMPAFAVMVAFST